MSTENERLFAAIAEKRGRPITPAEANIDVVGLQADLEASKQRLVDAIAAEQKAAVKKWIRHGMRGEIRVRSTPAMHKAIEEMYANGERHGNAELARAGIHGYAARSNRAIRIQALITKLQATLGSLNARLRKRTTELDLGALSRSAIADALAKVPGALDVASRMVSTATYRGLGAAFDQAKGMVDQASSSVASGQEGGNGWEYTAVMDGGTCDPCSEADGTTYPTWDEAQDDLPDGGPNPNCDGGDRCRCRLAPRPL